MSISIQLIDSIDVVSGRVNSAIANLVNNNITRGRSKAQAQIKNLVNSWIISQPEMQSILSSDLGSLAGQFGIRFGQQISAHSAIVASVLESITTQFSKFSNSLSGNFTISIQPDSFQNLLSLPNGHVYFRGGDLHWLEWLLLRGDTTIVANYQYKPQSGAGRSRLGYMIAGSSFRVPPQFSGVADNNFITRALTGEEQDKQITEVIENLVSGTI